MTRLQPQDKAPLKIREQVLGLEKRGKLLQVRPGPRPVGNKDTQGDTVGAMGGSVLIAPWGEPVSVPLRRVMGDGKTGTRDDSGRNVSGRWASTAPLSRSLPNLQIPRLGLNLGDVATQLWGGRSLEKCPAQGSPKERCGANCLLGTGGGLPRQPPAGDVVGYANTERPLRTSLPFHVYIRAPRISQRTLRLGSLITEEIGPARCGAPRPEPVAAAPHRRLRCRDGGDGQLPVLPVRALL